MLGWQAAWLTGLIGSVVTGQVTWSHLGYAVTSFCGVLSGSVFAILYLKVSSGRPPHGGRSRAATPAG